MVLPFRVPQPGGSSASWWWDSGCALGGELQEGSLTSPGVRSREAARPAAPGIPFDHPVKMPCASFLRCEVTGFPLISTFLVRRMEGGKIPVFLYTLMLGTHSLDQFFL